MTEAQIVLTRHTELQNDGIGRCDIAHLRDSCFIPDTIAINNCSLKDHDVNRDLQSLEAPFFASYFASGLTLPLHPFTRAVLTEIGICPCQGNGNFYKIINCFIMLGKLIKEDIQPADLFWTFKLNYERKYQSVFFRRRANTPELLGKLPTNDDIWNKYPLLVLGNWEFGSESMFPLARRVLKTKNVDLADVCTRLNTLVISRGEPLGYNERSKKIMKERTSKRNFEELLQNYSVYLGPMSVRSLREEGSSHTLIEAPFNASNAAIPESSSKRKLRSFDEPAPKKAALYIPIINDIAEIEDSSPEQSLRHRSTKSIRSSNSTSSQVCIPNTHSVDSEISLAALEMCEIRASVQRSEEPAEQFSSVLEETTKMKSMMCQYLVEPIQYRSIEEERANVSSWAPSFGRDSNKVFSKESSFFNDQNDALDFVMGMRTPKDDIYLSSNDELSKHYLAQHHMAKALMLLSSNNDLVESASKKFANMESLLGRLSTENKSLICRNKELEDWKLIGDSTINKLEQEVADVKENWESTKSELGKAHDDNINLQNTITSYSNTIESLSAQLIDVATHKNEAEDQCAKVCSEKIIAEDRSAELQVELNNAEALCAELRQKLQIAHTEQSQLLAHNATLQTKLDGAPIFYQDLINKQAKDYFIRGLHEGHQKCLDLYGLEEINSDPEEDNDENIDLGI